MTCAQTLPPLGVTASRNIGPGGQFSVRLGPSGDVYLTGGPGQYPWSAATKSYGDTTQLVTYVSRVGANGTAVFTTALGGILPSLTYIDASGNVFLSGSARTGFYVTPGAYRTTPPSTNSGFVCKLSGADGSVQYCTYMDFLGGANGGGVDLAGDFVAVVGVATYRGSPLPPPSTPGAVHPGNGGVYVAKLNPAGSALVYAAEFGGSAQDVPGYSAVDAAGSVYITGQTTSADFPTTPGAAYGYPGAAGSTPEYSFLTKLSPDGSSLIYSTLGLEGEQPLGIALDSSGDAQILYWAESLQVDVRRYNADGSKVLFDALTGIVAQNSPSGSALMAVDGGGNTSVFLPVKSITAALVNPTQTCQFFPIGADYQGGITDNGFMVRLDPSGKVQQSTYLQGTGAPVFEDVAALAPGSMTMAVWSGSPSQLQVLTIAPAPPISLSCIGSSASLSNAPLAAGEIVSLFGQGIGPAEPIVAVPEPQYPPGSGGAESSPTEYQFPFTLGATSVTFDGVAAPLLYVSGTQTNTVIPFTAKSNTTHVCVTYSSNPPSCMDAPIVFAAPAIFTIPQMSQQPPYAAAVNQDGTINSQSNPAPRGSIISLFATGLGPLSSTPADGYTVSLPLLTQDLKVTLESSNSPYQEPPPEFTAPAWAGQAPFEIAGLSQVNAVVPDYGNVILLQVTQSGAGGLTVSSPSVSIWVK
ncbi:MAG TPA: hypothetical protein VGM43_04305 [Bryobacteraceae bacterium]